MSAPVGGTHVEFTPPGPVAGAFLNTAAKVALLMGPYGSGKTTVGTIAMLKNMAETKPDSDGVIRWRGVVVRSTYQMLVSATIPTVAKILPASVGKITMGSPIQKIIRAPGLEATIDFIALDQDADRRRVEGSTYNMAWVDESRETSWPLIQTLLTRVRAKNDKGEEQPLRIVFTSNPSGKRHWMYRKFVEDRAHGWELFHQPGGRSPNAENLKYLPKGYYEDMAATSDPSFTSVHVDSNWGDEIIGAAVVPEFRTDTHVAREPLQYAPGLPLVVGIDGGPTLHPAAVVGQIVPIENRGKVVGRQLRILFDWHAENVGAQRAARELRAAIQWRFGDLRVHVATIDPAASNQKEAGHETVFTDIWKATTRWNIQPAKSNKLQIRVEGLRSLFQRLSGGVPAVMICPTCEDLIGALAGEYRWKQVTGPNGITASETDIDKLNRPYADLGDAAGYLALGSGEYDAITALARSGRLQGRSGKIRIADGVSPNEGMYGPLDPDKYEWTRTGR